MDSSLLQIIKQAATEAVLAEKPCDFVMGKVVSIEPLKIQLSQKATLEEDFLVVPRSLTDYTVPLDIAGGFSSGAHSQYTGTGAHTHTVSGGTATVHNALQVGEHVLLLRQSGGQKYLILDKVVTG